MTDEPKEGNLPNDEGGVANSIPSGEGSQPLEANLVALSKRIEQLEHENRALQSGKDKRWNEVMPIVKKVATMLNVDEAKVVEAQRTMVLDDLVAERMTGTRPEDKPSGSGEPKGASIEVAAIVSALGLNAADTDVAAVIAGNADTTMQIAELSKLAVSRASKPSPTPGQLPSPSGGAPAGSGLSKEDEEKKAALLQKLYKHPTMNAAEIEKLEKELGW